MKKTIIEVPDDCRECRRVVEAKGWKNGNCKQR